MTEKIVTALWLAEQKRTKQRLVGVIDVALYLEKKGIHVPDEDWGNLEIILNRMYAKKAHMDEPLWLARIPVL